MCAKASSVPSFNYCKALFTQLTLAGAKYMINTNHKHQSRAWFNLGTNCDSEDNMCESFNHWIVDVRAYPFISMLEGIQTKVFVRIQQKQEQVSQLILKDLSKHSKKLNKYINLAHRCSAIWNGKDNFEVKDLNQSLKWTYR